MALLTVEEAAARLGTSTRFIRRLTSEKRIPYVKLGGGSHVRIEEDDLDAFVAAGRIEPTPRQIPLAYPQIHRDHEFSGTTRRKV
jgi:excisionase family DNA binding protein